MGVVEAQSREAGDEERGNGEGLLLGAEARSGEVVESGLVVAFSGTGPADVGARPFSCGTNDLIAFLVGAGVDSGGVVLLSARGDGTLGDERRVFNRVFPFFPFLVAGFFFAAGASE